MLKLDSKQPRKLYIYINIILYYQKTLPQNLIYLILNCLLHKQMYLLYMTKKDRACLIAEPDFTKCDMFLDQHLCWPWNNIVINQSYLKNTFIIFVKFRLTISVWCLYISHSSIISSDFIDYS